MKTKFSFIPIIGVILGLTTAGLLIGLALSGNEKGDSACMNTKFTSMFAPYDSLMDRPLSYITGPEYDFYTSSCFSVAEEFAQFNISWSEERNIFGFKKIRPANNLLWMWMWFVNNDLISFKYNHGYSNYIEENNCIDYNFSRTETNSDGLQLNFQTPLLDGSIFYKRSLASNMELRLMDGSGKLKNSINADLVAPDNVFHLYDETNNVFSEYPDKDRFLHIFYALLTREHNYWCDRLLELNPSWQEDDLYNTARHVVMGEIQAITYRDALPVLLGKELPIECYHDQENNLMVSTEFATVGLNIILSMVPDIIAFRSSSTSWNLKNCSVLSKAETFWQTGIEDWLVAAYHSKARPVQPSFTNNQFFCDLTNYTTMEFLLSKEREHQLPYYATLYHHYTGKPLDHFRQITSNPEIFLSLQATYSSPQDVGLLVGLLAEEPQSPSLLGTVGTRMLSEQFKMIRKGQGRFYLWDIVVAEYRAEIHHTKLSTLILRHTTASKKNIHPGNTFEFISN